MNGKQLKNSILQWAIQGKLVPQDPNDEPASVLLERIREEKARLVKEGKLKKQKNESIIFRGDDNSHYEKFIATGEVKCIDDEIPFEIPETWKWCRIGNLCDVVRGGSPRPAGSPIYYNGYIPFLKVADLTNNNLMFVSSYTSTIKEAGLKKTRLVPANTLLLTNSGATLGVPKICTFDTTFNDGIAAFLYLPKFLYSYIYWFLLSKTDEYRKINQGTAQPNLNTDIIKGTLLALPPLKEQQRIVTLVEELLPFVEKYSEAQCKLDTLNTSINETLKKSILQEAIQGKLVPQDPNDEPASVLLQRIKDEKERLIKEKKIKRDKTDSVIFKGDDNRYYERIGKDCICIDDDLPFEIPTNWRWTYLGDLLSNTSGLAYKKENLDVKSEKPIRVLRGGNIEEGIWFTKDDDVMIAPQFVNDELFLRKGTFITPAVTSLEKIGKTALIEEDLSDVVVGGFVLILHPYYKENTLLRYMLYFFQSAYYKSVCKGITNKSGQAFYNLSRAKLMKCYVPIPPKSELERITKRIDGLFEHIAK